MEGCDDFILELVAAHLRGMRPAPTSNKDTLMLTEKTQTLTLLIELLTNYSDYINFSAFIRIRIEYVSIRNVHEKSG